MWYVGEKRSNMGGLVLLRSVVGVGAVLAVLASGQAWANEVAGQIVSVEGTVFVRQDGRAPASALAPAKPGDSVRAGDVINSASDGKIKILMKDHTILDLGPSALFKIDQFKANQGANREVEVNMVYGSLRAAVAQKLAGKGKFKLRTPSAVMGVRGTEFIVKSDAPADLKQVSAAIANPEKPVLAQGSGQGGDASAASTQVTVVQGRVDVEPKASTAGSPQSLEKPVALTAGTQLTTQVGEAAAPKAVTVDAQQMTQLRETVKVQDNTFSKAVTVDPAAGGASGGGVGGEVTRQAVTTAVTGAIQGAPALTMGSAGFAGTFGNNQTFTPVNQNFLQAGMLRTITVNVIAP